MGLFRSKKIQKTLVLAFKANSTAFVPPKWTFFRVLASLCAFLLLFLSPPLVSSSSTISRRNAESRRPGDWPKNQLFYSDKSIYYSPCFYTSGNFSLKLTMINLSGNSTLIRLFKNRNEYDHS